MDVIRWEFEPEGLRKPILVAAFGGWNDAAASASSALSFLAEQLGAQKVATIDPESFYDFQSTRPIIDLSVPGHHSVTWPDVEIYEARLDDGDHDLLLLAGSEPSMRWRTFCETVISVARKLGVEQVVTLGALLADVAHTRPIRLTGLASSPELIEGLNTRTPSYQGPTGIVGVLHHAVAIAGLESVSLWAPVPHYAAGVTNPKGAHALLSGLRHVTGISIDLADLASAADEHEAQVSRAVSNDQRLQALVERLENEGPDDELSLDPGALPSGDELAEELERFLRQREEPPQ